MNTAGGVVDCEQWQGHVIVCGLEGVGLRTVEQLRGAGVAVVVVDDDPDEARAELVKGWGSAYMRATGSLDDELQLAGIAGARAVVCTQTNDLRNVETALLVRDRREDIAVVAHLDNPTVGRAVEEATGEGSALDVAGLFAPAVVDACMLRTSHEVVLGGEGFVAAEVTVKAPGSLRLLFGDLVPVGVVTGEGELIVCPGRDQQVASGDLVTVLGRPDELAAAEVGRPLDQEEPPRQRGGSVRQELRRISRTLAQGTDRAVGITLVLSL
ncbi:MAG TPA: NAD-binding protein, partial [Solirubrobacterales bacterium]|nr:NAD-binding protein [Solirubrobacterales bacterium]